MKRQRLGMASLLMLSLPWVFAPRAIAQDSSQSSNKSPSQDRAEVIRHCVNGLLYSQVSAEGQPEISSRTDFPEQWVARVCRPVRSLEGAQAKRICVNGLLYQTIAEDGSPVPSTKSSEIVTRDAVRACDGVYRQDIAAEQRRCVNGLLYQTISDQGTPRLASRTELAVRTAIDNCALPPKMLALKPRPTQPPRRPFAIHNGTGQVIETLYFSHALARPWGDNAIEDKLQDGDSTGLSLVGGCSWELKAELADGQVLERAKVDTCSRNNYLIQLDAQR